MHDNLAILQQLIDGGGVELRWPGFAGRPPVQARGDLADRLEGMLLGLAIGVVGLLSGGSVQARGHRRPEGGSRSDALERRSERLRELAQLPPRLVGDLDAVRLPIGPAATLDLARHQDLLDAGSALRALHVGHVLLHQGIELLAGQEAVAVQSRLLLLVGRLVGSGAPPGG